MLKTSNIATVAIVLASAGDVAFAAKSSDNHSIGIDQASISLAQATDKDD
jgi:hypothetical protein